MAVFHNGTYFCVGRMYRNECPWEIMLYMTHTCISRDAVTTERPWCIYTSGSMMTYWHSTTGSNTTFVNINTAILSSPTSRASTRVATIWTSSTYTSMTGFQSLALILMLAGQALTNKTENKHHATVSLIKYYTIYNLLVY